MRNEQIVKKFSDKKVLADQLAIDFSNSLQLLMEENEKVYIAISGGNTPTLFFRALVENSPKVEWERVRLFWVDERCVPPDHPESNFGVANKELIRPLNIPSSSVFRIDGEASPSKEAKAYGEKILDIVTPELSFPVFDIVFLGMGEDGHTASVFPDQMSLWDADSLCGVGTHPETGQARVTFTGRLINSASRIIFMVTGRDKAEVVKDVIARTGDYQLYPAALVEPISGKVEWYLDNEAAIYLSKK